MKSYKRRPRRNVRDYRKINIYDSVRFLVKYKALQRPPPSSTSASSLLPPPHKDIIATKKYTLNILFSILYFTPQTISFSVLLLAAGRYAAKVFFLLIYVDSFLDLQNVVRWVPPIRCWPLRTQCKHCVKLLSKGPPTACTLKQITRPMRFTGIDRSLTFYIRQISSSLVFSLSFHFFSFLGDLEEFSKQKFFN